jgi:hypothetical protein
MAVDDGKLFFALETLHRPKVEPVADYRMIGPMSLRFESPAMKPSIDRLDYILLQCRQADYFWFIWIVLPSIF